MYPIIEAATLFFAISLLILLAVTSLRYGVDSREIFPTRDGDRFFRGIV